VSSKLPESPLQTCRRLWRQAPLWRLTGMTAALMTLLFVLFFPSNHSARLPTTAGVADQASYAGHPAVASVNVTPAPAVTSSGAPSAPVNTAPQPLQKYASKLPDAVAAASSSRPQTASLALAVPGGAQAVGNSGLDSALLGRTYSGSVRVDGYDLPLPAGSWALLAKTSVKQPSLSLAGEVIYLGRIRKRRLEGAIRITAVRSTTTPGKGFRQVKGCVTGQADSSYVMAEQVVAFGQQSCWLVQNYFTNPFQQWADRATHLDPLLRAVAGDLAAKGVSYPQDMMMVRFTRAETWGMLEVGYMFSPEAEGITSAPAVSYADSDWHVGNIDRFPEKLAYVEKLKHWGAEFWPQFKAAFAGGENHSS
jgi:hypothetical protein